VLTGNPGQFPNIHRQRDGAAHAATPTAGENRERTMNLTSTLLAAAASAALTTGVGAAAGPTTTTEPTRPWPVSDACSTFVEERNRQLLEQRLDLLAAGDFAAEQEFFSHDATVVVHGSVPYAGTYDVAGGHYGQMLGSVWQFGSGGNSGEEPQLFADCATVTLFGRFSATSRATGQLLDTTVIEQFTFDAYGKIVRDDFYFTDTAEVNRVLGIG
jgi:ketosteroid isomerase-like protein